MQKITLILIAVITLSACKNNQNKFDATGTFEADEVIVSAQQSGQILSLNIHEGDALQKGQSIGNIDVSNLQIQKEQVKATINSLREKLNSATPQVEVVRKQLAVQQSQLDYLLKEKTRLQNLLKADAATQKQLDDMNAKVEEAHRQLAVLKQQIHLSTSNVHVQNQTILSEKNPLEKSADQIEDQIKKGIIINPVKGTVLTKYAFEGEMTGAGKALYKIANIDTITLRAYVTGAQLPGIKTGQQVSLKTDNDGKYKDYKGTLYWVSDKAEFTPKTIQTKDERENLVYAIKIRVPNDGYLKIGMYGEVNF